MDNVSAVSGKPLSPPPLEAQMRLIEEKYSVPPDDDESLITVTSVPGFTSVATGEAPWFNGIENMPTREVTITGVTLTWDDSSKALMALNTTRDVTRLTIIADKVVIARPVSWKGADVTVIARNLEFTGNGVISTQPEPYGVVAFSKDRDDAGHPIDPASKQVKARDGLPGCRAGSITLKVDTVKLGGAGITRFDCRGGSGQQGETGGYLPRPDGKPVNAQVLSIEDIDHAIRDSANSSPDLNSLSHWWYPGGDANFVNSTACRVTTDLYGGLALRGLLASGKVTHVRLVLSYLYGKMHATGVDLPSHRRCEDAKLMPDDINKPLPPPAFPSGKTGKGGNGGALLVPDKIKASLIGAYHGEGGDSRPSEAVPGKAGTPAEYCVFGMQIAQNSFFMATPSSLPISLMYYTAEVGAGCAGSAAGVGTAGTVQALNATPAPSWLDQRLIGLVLTRARRQLAMGHREDAQDTILPYYNALKSAHEADGNLTASWQAVDALTTTLAMNLDLYGHPAGWVPRFSADSYFKLYFADRSFSYKFCYMMGKAMALADSTERAWQVLSTVASQTDAAIDQIHVDLGNTYIDFHAAQKELDATLDRMKQFQLEMDGIKAQAEEDAEAKIKRDRIIKAVFNTAGAICSALPVGQPYLSGVGSVLNGVGDATAALDPTQSGPEQALGFLSALSGKVATSLDKNAGAFKSQFDDNLKQKYKDKLSPDEQDLKKQIALGRNQLSSAEDAANAKMGPVYDEVLANAQLQKLLSTQATDVDAAAAAAGDAAALRLKFAEYNKSIAEITPAALGSATGNAEVAAKARQNLVAAKSKVYAQLADLDNVVAQKRKAAAASTASVTDMKKRIDDLKAAEATRKNVADQKDKLESILAKADRKNDEKSDAESKATFAKALDTTQKMASGISSSAAAIRDTLRPVSADDQDVQKLRDTIMAGGFEQEFDTALEHLTAAKEARGKALQGLQDCSQRMLTGIANLHNVLDASVAISRNRQALAANIDAGVRDHMQAMAQAASERMDYYLYLVRKAYMYEQLEPAGEGLAQVNEFTQRFDSWLAKNREPLPSGANLPAAADRTAELAALNAIAGRDFGWIGDQVLNETLSELGQRILEHRQDAGAEHGNGFPLSLSAKQRADLASSGMLGFASMANLFPEADALTLLNTHSRVRVSGITLEKFVLSPAGEGFDQPIRLELTVGRTFPLRSKDGDWLLFRLAEREAPMVYGFVVSAMKSSDDGKTWSGTIGPDGVSTVDELYKTVMAKATGGQAPAYTEMAPSLMSQLTMRVVMGGDQIKDIVDLGVRLSLRFD